VFVPAKPFLPNLKSARRPGAYPRVDNINVDSIGQALTLPANIRIGRKDLTEKNIIAYYKL
jgi:hypothetical protein